ncbi:hypothetical protein K457DRAFT_16197 [Linnemannia elongata AG-77]|uniref:Uncharacterized protein n=1 Tax=Linnemannia elongata AG-77 TaxID=1314771 RepID=A0A197K893_9FUNG|nr:hypothetical protein K457DRAFT_16197 [Linnemannia elongata AG-77]
MQQPSPNPCQSSRNRGNPRLARTIPSIASASSLSYLTSESNRPLLSAASETGQATALNGSEVVVEGATTIGGGYSLFDRICSSQSSPATTPATSHYRTPDNKILFSDPSSSSAISTFFNNTVIALSPTTLSMLPVPSASITHPSYPALSTSSATSSSPPCPPSSASSAPFSSSGPFPCSMPPTTSFSSTLPFELSPSDQLMQPDVISQEGYQDHLDKEPLLLSGLSSEILLRQCRDQHGELTSQAENNPSPDQQHRRRRSHRTIQAVPIVRVISAVVQVRALNPSVVAVQPTVHRHQ